MNFGASNSHAAEEGSALLPKEPAPPRHPPKAARSEALDTLRLLGALHIITCHSGMGWQRRVVDPGGPTIFRPTPACWVGYFLLLSAYGSGASKLRAGEPFEAWQGWSQSWRTLIPSSTVLLRRVMSVYPTYAISVLASVPAAMYWLQVPPANFGWGAVVAELTFLSSYGVSIPLSAQTAERVHVNQYGWFIGSMTTFWLLEPGLFRLACAFHARRRLLVAVALVVVWVAATPFAGCPLTWGYTPDFMGPLNSFGLTLMTVHQYFLGLLLACALHTEGHKGGSRRGDDDDSHGNGSSHGHSNQHRNHHGSSSDGATGGMLFACFAPVGLLVLGAIFAWEARCNYPSFHRECAHSSPVDRWAVFHNICWVEWVGVLLPIFACIIVGVVRHPTGGVATALAAPPLPALGRQLSLGIYLFQNPVARGLMPYLGYLPVVPRGTRTWRGAPDDSPYYDTAEVFALLVLTTSVAALVSFAVQQPVDRYMASRLKAGGHR